MGTRVAPTYACLYMSYFETEKILKTWSGTPPTMFKRYIDDIFFVWTSTVEELKKFIHHMNSQSQYIKFTSEYNSDTRKVPFLDMMIDSSGDKFSTDLYKKETFKPQYLHPSSCHVGHQSKNIPYSLAYRLRRICSDDTNFELRLTELKADLISRGYHSKIIDSAFNKVRLVPRLEALKKVSKSQNEREVFVVTFHPALPSVNTIVKKHWSVMTEQSANLKRVFPKPSLIAYRRPKNLREHLIRAKISSKRRSSRLKKGYSPCNEGCQTWWVSKRTQSHSTKRTGKKWNISAPITCKTKNVIYHLDCKKKCKVFEEGYQGETRRELRARINEHRAGIRLAFKNKNVDHPIYGHFVTGHGKNPDAYLEVTGIEKVLPLGNDQLRKIRESYWINQYDSISYGANTRE